METRTFSFMATAAWAQDGVCDEIHGKTRAKATIRLHGPVNSGTLTITADNAEDVEAAVALVTNDFVYRKLFKTKVA